MDLSTRLTVNTSGQSSGTRNLPPLTIPVPKLQSSFGSGEEDEADLNLDPEQMEEKEIILSASTKGAEPQPETTLPKTLIDNRPSVTIYKGRKYNWQAKVNLHIHIIQHKQADMLEVVAFNTGILQEAPHVYVSSKLIESKIKVEHNQHLVDEVVKEYEKMNAKPPLKRDIDALLRKNAIAAYVCDRITVSLKPTFTIDVKDIVQSYRIPLGKGTEIRQSFMDVAKSVTDRSHIESAAPFAPHPNERATIHGNVSTGINLSTARDSVAVLDHSGTLHPPSQRRRDSYSVAAVSPGGGRNTTTSASGGGGEGGLQMQQQLQEVTISLLQRKPEALDETEVKRFGRSTTLVGSVLGESTNPEEEALRKFIANHNSPAVHSSTAVSRLTGLNFAGARKQQQHKARAQKPLFNFQKFRNDNDLLMEALSFIHISEFMRFRLVCKRWQRVLSDALKFMNHLVITSRDFHNKELRAKKVGFATSAAATTAAEAAGRITDETSAASVSTVTTEASTLTRKPSSRSRERKQGGKHSNNSHNSADGGFGDGNDDDSEDGNDEDPYWRKVFVRTDTLFRVLQLPTVPIHTLKLHYVIINLKFIGSLSDLAGRLKYLSLGIIKVDDTVVDEEALQKAAEEAQAKKEAEAAAVLKAQRDARLAARRAGGSRSPSPTPPVIGGRAQRVNSRAGGMRSGSTSPLPPAPEPIAPPPIAPEVPVSTLRFMNGNDVKGILFACGSDLVHLELSITIGDIPQEAFRHTPKLQSLTAMDTVLSDKVCSSRVNFEGRVHTEEFVASVAGVKIPDLLSLMSDASHEAFLLTDKRGHIVVANDAWQRLTGYSCEEVSGIRIGFLRGPLTEEEEFEKILEAIKCQIAPETAVTFMHRPDGQAYLCQIIFIPNAAQYRGVPLNYESLSQDFLTQLAMDQMDEENNNDRNQRQFGKTKGMKDFIVGLKNHSYHLMRFGCLCEPFAPDDLFRPKDDATQGMGAMATPATAAAAVAALY